MSAAHDDHGEDYSCPVCHELYLAPVVLPCGHVYCRGCLVRILRSAQQKCAVCRAAFHVTSADRLRTCGVLEAALQQLYPEQMAERAREAAAAVPAVGEPVEGSGEPCALPLFVLDAMLPLQHMRLHVFEPRYTLMIEQVSVGRPSPPARP